MKHEVTLGKLADDLAQRDAVHIAVAPMIAAHPLAPGQEVGFVDDANKERAGTSQKPFGIVDPFLKEAVKQEQRFYVFLFPQTITSLRHDWTHPAVVPTANGDTSVITDEMRRNSRGWLERFAEDAHMNYDDVIFYAGDYLQTGECYVQYGGEEARDASYLAGRVFWDHFEVVTGQVVPVDEKDSIPFLCSC